MKKIKLTSQQRQYIPGWLRWTRFIWYLIFAISLSIFGIMYLMGIAAAVEQKKWTKKAAEIAYVAIPIAILALWIYPVIWFRKRRKVIKLISEYMVN